MIKSETAMQDALNIAMAPVRDTAICQCKYSVHVLIYMIYMYIIIWQGYLYNTPDKSHTVTAYGRTLLSAHYVWVSTPGCMQHGFRELTGTDHDLSTGNLITSGI